MSIDNDTAMGLRFIQSVTSVLRPICEVRSMLVPEDKIAVNDGLARIGEKSEVIALGEMVQSLARDIILVLRCSYEENPACASMVVRLEEAERNLVATLADMRTCLLSCNDKL